MVKAKVQKEKKAKEPEKEEKKAEKEVIERPFEYH